MLVMLFHSAFFVTGRDNKLMYNDFSTAKCIFVLSALTLVKCLMISFRFPHPCIVHFRTAFKIRFVLVLFWLVKVFPKYIVDRYYFGLMGLMGCSILIDIHKMLKFSNKKLFAVLFWHF